MPEIPCSNCGATVSGRYCPACGQPRQGRLSFAALARSSIGSLIDLDRGFARTVRSLTVSPGAAAREFVDGRRLPYTHPVKYCFIAITVYALAVNFLEIRIEVPGREPRTDLEMQLFYIVHGLLAYLIFLSLYPAAALQAGLFRDSGLNVAECYVFGLYTYGHVNWLSTLFAVTRWVETTAGLTAIVLIQWLYLLWALKGFYGCGRPPVLRSILLLVVNALTLNVLSVLLANLIFQLGLVDFLSRLLVS